MGSDAPDLPDHVPRLRIQRGPAEVLVKGHSDRTWGTHWSIVREHRGVLGGQGVADGVFDAAVLEDGDGHDAGPLGAPRRHPRRQVDGELELVLARRDHGGRRRHALKVAGLAVGEADFAFEIR